MAKFWKRHWFDAVMAVAGVLFYLFVTEDKRLFLALLFMIGGHNFVVWVRKGKLR